MYVKAIIIQAVNCQTNSTNAAILLMITEHPNEHSVQKMSDVMFDML